MHKFCRLTLDHSHVQSNKCIKGEGVVVGLKEDCSLKLKFGRARNCSSAGTKFAIFTLNDGKADTRHREQAILHYMSTLNLKAIESRLCMLNAEV